MVTKYGSGEGHSVAAVEAHSSPSTLLRSTVIMIAVTQDGRT